MTGLLHHCLGHDRARSQDEAIALLESSVGHGGDDAVWALALYHSSRTSLEGAHYGSPRYRELETLARNTAREAANAGNRRAMIWMLAGDGPQTFMQGPGMKRWEKMFLDAGDPFCTKRKEIVYHFGAYQDTDAYLAKWWGMSTVDGVPVEQTSMFKAMHNSECAKRRYP